MLTAISCICVLAIIVAVGQTIALIFTNHTM